MNARVLKIQKPYPDITMYGIMVTAHVNCGESYVTKYQDQSAFEVTFYTKTGCHLCEEARDMLEDIAALTTYELTEIDIRSDPATFEKYRYRIPVIVINNENIIEGRIEFRELARAFQLR